MRSSLRLAAGLFIASSIVSCQKSTELDPAVFEMDLESKAVKKNLQVGMEYQGGIIFYLDETGKHGLIAAKEDLGPAPWGCYGTSFFDALMMADTKTANKILLAGCKEPGTAVRLCAKYEVREKGKNGRVYKDWYMAGFREYGMIISALKRNANMCGVGYWTFMEMKGWQAGTVDPSKYVFGFSPSCTSPENPIFSYGFFGMPHAKNAKLYARPIRDF
jgi:hypothetical protein